MRFIVDMGSPADGVSDEGNNKLKLLGSVTKRVSEISDRPVMIVKQ